MTEHMLAVVGRIESLLSAAECGESSIERLLGPLWQLTGATCMCGDWLAGEPSYEWCSRVHSLRDAISYTVRTGKPVEAELARVRRTLLPLFMILSHVKEMEECAV